MDRTPRWVTSCRSHCSASTSSGLTWTEPLTVKVPQRDNSYFNLDLPTKLISSSCCLLNGSIFGMWACMARRLPSRRLFLTIVSYGMP